MLVFTNDWTRRPFATAFCASKPAPSMTEGFEVFVHDVMAAITTAPCASVSVCPFDRTLAVRPRSAAERP